jgi:hypothetical protein
MSTTIKRPTTEGQAFQPQIFEVFERLTNYKQEGRRIEYLKAQSNFELRTILTAAFNPTIKFGLPEGAPPYKADKTNPGEAMSSMKNVMKNFPVLLASNPTPQVKKENVLVSMLEGVNYKNAEIIIAAKDKKLTELYPVITLELVQKAIPEVLK